jgi:hypothetical protein
VSENGARHSVRILADRPIDADPADRLGHGVYADALAAMIDHRGTATPLTVAVTGPWGSGKTSVVRLMHRRLGVVYEWPEPHLVCWFNAWLHDDAPALGTALAAAVADAVNRERRWWWHLVKPVGANAANARRHARRRFGSLAVAVALTVALFALGPVRELLPSLLGSGPRQGLSTAARDSALAGVLLLGVGFAAAVRWLFTATSGLTRFLADPGGEAGRGAVEAVRRELGALISQALGGRRRLVVVIDDLDRCRPDRALEVCETAAKLLDHPEVITVVIGEAEQLAEAASARFAPVNDPDPEAARRTRERGWRYLEKIVNLTVALPPPAQPEIRDLLLGPPAQDAALLDSSAVGLRLSAAHRITATWRAAVRRIRDAWRDLVWRRFWLHLGLSVPVGAVMLFARPAFASVFGTGPEGSDQRVSEQIKLFIAPIAAILVGLVGLKYLFGDSRSLAGFISFLVLGILVFVLILYGNQFLDGLGGAFRSWVA